MRPGTGGQHLFELVHEGREQLAVDRRQLQPLAPGLEVLPLRLQLLEARAQVLDLLAFSAGTTVRYRRRVAEYPAGSGWTLTLHLAGASVLARTPSPGSGPAPSPGPSPTPGVQTTTIRLVGTVQPEVWNRLGTKLLPKLRSGSDLRVGVDFSVTVNNDVARNLTLDLRQIVDDLGLAGKIEIRES